MKKGIYLIGVIIIGLWFAVALTLILLVVMLFDASRRGVGKKLLRKIWSGSWYFGEKQSSSAGVKVK